MIGARLIVEHLLLHRTNDSVINCSFERHQGTTGKVVAMVTVCLVCRMLRDRRSSMVQTNRKDSRSFPSHALISGSRCQ